MKVGVPVVPGTPGPVATWTEADAFIKEYGFPGSSASFIDTASRGHLTP